MATTRKRAQELLHRSRIDSTKAYKVTAARASQASVEKRKRSAEPSLDIADPTQPSRSRLNIPQTEQQLKEQALESTGSGRNMPPAGIQERSEPPAAYQEHTEPSEMQDV